MRKHVWFDSRDRLLPVRSRIVGISQTFNKRLAVHSHQSRQTPKRTGRSRSLPGNS
jgi:hypothetical protein